MNENPDSFIPSSNKFLGERYQLLELLGDGTHGWVWRAERLSDHRIVALKIPKQRIKEDRELREGKELVNAPSHKNVIRVYWMGRIPPEKIWYGIEMEYFPSSTLAQLLENRLSNFSASYDRLFDIYEQVLAAGEHLSSLTPPFSHGDIKPHNILVGEGGLSKLTDFGSSALPDEIYARTRENGGTVLYSAPEFADCYCRKGSFVELMKADIYSLGVLLYQLVTARLPHDTPSQVHKHAPFPKPCEINSTICPQLEYFILKALERSPENRFGSIEEMKAKFLLAKTAQSNFNPRFYDASPYKPARDWSTEALEYMGQGRYEQAAEIAREEFSRTGDIHARIIELRALYQDERYFLFHQKLSEHRDILESSEPNAMGIRKLTLNAYLKLRRVKDAEDVLRKIEHLDEASPEILLAKASIYGLQAKYKDALQLLTQLNQNYPGKPSILRRLVLVYEQLRKPERAISYLKAYIRLEPKEKWAQDKMDHYRRLGFAV